MVPPYYLCVDMLATNHVREARYACKRLRRYAKYRGPYTAPGVNVPT